MCFETIEQNDRGDGGDASPNFSEREEGGGGGGAGGGGGHRIAKQKQNKQIK